MFVSAPFPNREKLAWGGDAQVQITHTALQIYNRTGLNRGLPHGPRPFKGWRVIGDLLMAHSMCLEPKTYIVGSHTGLGPSRDDVLIASLMCTFGVASLSLTSLTFGSFSTSDLFTFGGIHLRNVSGPQCPKPE